MDSKFSRAYLQRQYQDATNLNARIVLHQRFSVNPYGWHRWVFDHLQVKEQARWLEIGCGSGALWLENLERLPAETKILLTDFSAGMIAQAQASLGDHEAFTFQILDADNTPLPLDSASFDGVIANHMIYHLAHPGAFLAEAHRILKPGARFFAATNGENHLQEMAELIHRFKPELLQDDRAIASFTLENGFEQLSDWFGEVVIDRYPDALEVTDADLLTDYILSGFTPLDEVDRKRLPGFVSEVLSVAGGAFHISKDAGLFIARRAE